MAEFGQSAGTSWTTLSKDTGRREMYASIASCFMQTIARYISAFLFPSLKSRGVAHESGYNQTCLTGTLSVPITGTHMRLKTCGNARHLIHVPELTSNVYRLTRVLESMTAAGEEIISLTRMVKTYRSQTLEVPHPLEKSRRGERKNQQVPVECKRGILES